MVMDKAWGFRQAEDLVESSGPFVDLVKTRFRFFVYNTPPGEQTGRLPECRPACLPGRHFVEAFIIGTSSKITSG